MDDFMDFSKPLKRKINITPNFNTTVKTENKRIKTERQQESGTEYSKKHQKKEKSELFNQLLNQPSTSSNIIRPKIEKDLNLKIEDELETKDVDPTLLVYERYAFDLKPKTDLPIYYYREKILAKIDENSVVVLTATTGTGKSTQVPQYILQEAFSKERHCNIVVTQPRKIAAITIAQRVATERKCELGSLVGYQVGLDKKLDTEVNSDTRILYCTTGVFLQKLINSKSMKDYTHVILDEVHERDLDMDFLLIIVRKLLAVKNPYVKIVLMSATLNAEQFAEYFRGIYYGNIRPAPILKLEAPLSFEVDIFYLDDLSINISDEITEFENPGISNEMFAIALHTLILCIQNNNSGVAKKNQHSPSFLIFLPGIYEIESFHKFLKEPRNQSEQFDITLFKICLLHSSISSVDQKDAFSTLKEMKIILATNMAESSVTLPDVKYVIDFCLTKYIVTDSSTNMSSLKIDWTSKNSCEQRAGRVGRTSSGHVYRLVSHEFYNIMPKYTTPEMLRSSLETSVLRTKVLNMGKPSEILGAALEPPDLRRVHDSILVLKEIGGMMRLGKDGKFDYEDGNLSLAGKIMSNLPLDVKISKLIILGYMFNVLEECIIIGAGLNGKTIFMHGFHRKMESYKEKIIYAKGSESDCIAFLNAYLHWYDCQQNEVFTNRQAELNWCTERHLDMKNLHEMKEFVNEITNRLKFHRLFDSKEIEMNDEDKLMMIKICIAGAFYPNYFFCNKKMTSDDHKVLGERDPFTTVYFKGMDQKYVGQLYEKEIRQYLVDAGVCDKLSDMKVSFDSYSTKVFVTFRDLSNRETTMEAERSQLIIPGRVLPQVYKALKQNRIESKMNIKVWDSNSIMDYAVNLGLAKLDAYGSLVIRKKLMIQPRYCKYPMKIDREMKGTISHVVHCSKFYFQSILANDAIKLLEQAIELEPIKEVEDIVDGMNVIVCSSEVGKKRGKIIEFVNIPMKPSFVVYFTDYGFQRTISFDELFKCHSDLFDIPPQCFECSLTEIQPSIFKCPTGWSKILVEEFKNLIADSPVTIEIYSFVESIASVTLLVNDVNVNEHLLAENYAQTCDESYLSKLDHSKRELAQDRNDIMAPEKAFKDMEVIDFDEETIAPPKDRCRTAVTLDGPYSTLSVNLYGSCPANKKRIIVESSSVNHIVLDNNPNSGILKLYVAASVSKSKEEDHLILRQTTAMPHIPGFGTLMVLLFSSFAEIRCDKNRERYTSVLGGLGYDKDTFNSHFPQHDTVANVDVELDEDDFSLINDLRYGMSQLMPELTNETTTFMPKYQGVETKLRINDLIKRLLMKERLTLQERYTTDASEWGMMDKIELISRDLMQGIYSNHSYPKLFPMSGERVRSLKSKVDLIKKLSEINSNDKTITCDLCELTVDTLVDLKLHFYSKAHKLRYSKISELAMQLL